MSKSSQITWFDYIVLAAIMVISILIGFYHGFRNRIKPLMNKKFDSSRRDIEMTTRDDSETTIEIDAKNNKTSEYLMTNSSMSTIPVAFSILASFFSSTVLVGLPAEVYVYGIQIWIMTFGNIICPLIAAYITAPFFADHGVLSIFEYFEMRFNSRAVRLIGSFCYLIRSSISCNV